MRQVEHSEVLARRQFGRERLETVVRQSELAERAAARERGPGEGLYAVVRQRKLREQREVAEFVAHRLDAIAGRDDGVERAETADGLEALERILVGDERTEVGGAADAVKGVEAVAADVQHAKVGEETGAGDGGVVALALEVAVRAGLLPLGRTAAAAVGRVRGAHAERRERGAVEVVIREVQVLQARQARERVHARAGADDVIAQVELGQRGARASQRRVHAADASALEMQSGDPGAFQGDPRGALERERGVEDGHGVPSRARAQRARVEWRSGAPRCASPRLHQ